MKKQFFLSTCIKKLVQGQRGTSSVLLALGITAFIGFLAFVTDVGVLYVEQTKLSNAVDAAALAGAKMLPDNPSQAALDAENYAQANGAPAGSVTVTVDTVNKEVKVEAKKTVDLYFAKVLGINSGDVGVSAKAKIGPVKAQKGVAPLAIEKTEFKYGEEYLLKSGDGENGWFGPLSLGGQGANLYEINLQFGYQEVLQAGTVVETETGNMSGPTTRGIEYRINECDHYPSCTVDNYKLDCPKIIYLPVIEPIVEGNQVKKVKIVGFAAFLAQAAAGSGNENEVRGYFIRNVSNGELDFGGYDFGLYGVKLIE